MPTTPYDTRMSADPEFAPVVRRLAAGLDGAVETGTYDGLGSTRVLAETGLPVTTVECDPGRHAAAVRNLAAHPNVRCLHAYSLPALALRAFVRAEAAAGPPAGVFADSADPAPSYLAELGDHRLPEDVLPGLIDNDLAQMILLDSAGGVGLLEFLAVVGLPPERLRRKVLVLDDVAHVKHYRSAAWLDARLPGGLWRAASGRWGYIDFRRIPTEEVARAVRT
jgi:hypothetical protein